MALTTDTLRRRRGRPESGNAFGYQVPAGEVIWRGSVFGLNAAGLAVRPQTAAAPGPAVVLVGISDKTIDNRVGTTTSNGYVVAEKGTWDLTVPAVTAANIGAPVYATDDNTFALTDTGNPAPLQIGTIAGIEAGQTYVRIKE